MSLDARRKDYSPVVDLSRRPPAGAVAIPMTKGYVVWVDEADFDAVSQFKWFTNEGYRHDVAYAVAYGPRRNGRQSKVLMHRLLGCPGAMPKVDHRAHWTESRVVDNRRSNLRPAGNDDNNRNARKMASAASRFKGVSRDGGKWRARITVDGRTFAVGSGGEIESAIAYDSAAVSAFGEFACTNFKTPGAGNWLYDPMPFGLVRHQPEV